MVTTSCDMIQFFLDFLTIALTCTGIAIIVFAKVESLVTDVLDKDDNDVTKFIQLLLYFSTIFFVALFVFHAF